MVIHIHCFQDQTAPIAFELYLRQKFDGSQRQAIYGNTCPGLATQDSYFDATLTINAIWPQGPFYFQMQYSNTVFAWTVTIYA